MKSTAKSTAKTLSTNDIVKSIAEKNEITISKSKEIIDSFLEEITHNLKAKNKITFKDFGTFKVNDRKARVGINPATREKINIPAKKVVKFVASKNLKNLFK